MALKSYLLLFCAVLACLAAAAAGVPGRAQAQPGLLVGVTDDALKWAQHPAPLQQAISELRLGAIRYTQSWAPGQTRLTAADATTLARGLANARGLRVVLSVYGSAAAAPQTDQARAQYCTYVRSILLRFPQIHDVVIWNEVNSSRFWSPQLDAARNPVAPAQYEALLAACYGPLQTARPGVNVIATVAPRGNDDPQWHGAVGIPPADFVRGMGAAYRASFRLVKVFDTFALNVYGLTSAERPWRTHDHAVDLSEGDYPRLLAALSDAFGGTGQPLPGVGGVSVWYLEDGFQTTIDPAKASLYTGTENDHSALPPVAPHADTGSPAATSAAPDQATQLADALRLAYCQPGVGAFFNFLLADEPNLAAWQSGVLWADWTPKPSFDALSEAIAQVRSGAIDCSTVQGAPAADSSTARPRTAGGTTP